MLTVTYIQKSKKCVNKQYSNLLNECLWERHPCQVFQKPPSQTHAPQWEPRGNHAGVSLVTLPVYYSETI